MNDLQKLYSDLNADINSRLAEFSSLYQTADDKKLFLEMCFCTCTPQNNAKKAWAAVNELAKQKLLLNGEQPDIASVLRAEGVRFHSNKAHYIIQNRENYYPKTYSILSNLITNNSPIDARNYLKENVYGWGFKEASHFLRNIGFGNSICILDRHILRQLVFYNVINEIPKTLSKSTYMSIESDMLEFAKKVNIPVDALDLLFWYKAKGELFK
jgi:N-glycosylase/DNA lyase